MKNRNLFLFLACFTACAVFALLGSSVHGESDTGQKPVKQTLRQKIQGTWVLEKNKRAATGTMVFKEDGTYELNETFHDDTKAGTKGQFELNTGTEPFQLKLCLGKCDQPGSEWVTRFCIIRMPSPDSIEIYQSSSGSYPTAFPEDKEDENFMVLKHQ